MLRRPAARAVAIVLAVALACYLAALGYLFLFQRSYVFVPSGVLASPAESGFANAEAIKITVADGTELAGWYAKPSPGRPTLLYFHGNAGNMSGRAKRFRQALDSGFGLLAMSYRGYPGSGGLPSEAAFFSDSLEIFDWLAAKTPDIVIYGESLGTAVAVHVAAERPGRALVLEAPFTSALDLAHAAYPWVPVSLLMRDPFLSREGILHVEEPLLIIHGTADGVVPIAMGREMFALAHEPKKLAVIDGAAHSDLWDHGLWPLVLGFLQTEGVNGAP
jgi:fermentation-respiration switch protein FrsA (DUF1100 family)